MNDTESYLAVRTLILSFSYVLTCAPMIEKPIHLHISKFEFTKFLNSSNLPVGSWGKSWRVIKVGIV